MGIVRGVGECSMVRLDISFQKFGTYSFFFLSLPAKRWRLLKFGWTQPMCLLRQQTAYALPMRLPIGLVWPMQQMNSGVTFPNGLPFLVCMFPYTSFAYQWNDHRLHGFHGLFCEWQSLGTDFIGWHRWLRAVNRISCCNQNIIPSLSAAKIWEICAICGQ